ncbi:hypothetical protein E3T43_04320 [Cryobacterium sp. Hh7]|uniref:hypothetical protein n=1 Tax=Cryobacterium sp. Hh7 TaxID=1259159 RepID=UPI001069CA20|nr:hypothetical protein [Cryobacterium sp. Hh7]TFD59339.1 hypothetical protein E3T43_04320 [Cryobacterium sp. Hh7]
MAAGRTQKNQLTGAIAALISVGAPSPGLVLTMLPTSGPDAYSYAYSYSYSYGYGYSYGDPGRTGPRPRHARQVLTHPTWCALTGGLSSRGLLK